MNLKYSWIYILSDIKMWIADAIAVLNALVIHFAILAQFFAGFPESFILVGLLRREINGIGY